VEYMRINIYTDWYLFGWSRDDSKMGVAGRCRCPAQCFSTFLLQRNPT